MVERKFRQFICFIEKFPEKMAQIIYRTNTNLE